MPGARAATQRPERRRVVGPETRLGAPTCPEGRCRDVAVAVADQGLVGVDVGRNPEAPTSRWKPRSASVCVRIPAAAEPVLPGPARRARGAGRASAATAQRRRRSRPVRPSRRCKCPLRSAAACAVRVAEVDRTATARRKRPAAAIPPATRPRLRLNAGSSRASRNRGDSRGLRQVLLQRCSEHPARGQRLEVHGRRSIPRRPGSSSSRSTAAVRRALPAPLRAGPASRRGRAPGVAALAEQLRGTEDRRVRRQVGADDGQSGQGDHGHRAQVDT